MKGNGQYIYVHPPAASRVAFTLKPLLAKFNNGHFGGGHEVLFNNKTRAHPKGICAGMYEQCGLKEQLADSLVSAPAAEATV